MKKIILSLITVFVISFADAQLSNQSLATGGFAISPNDTVNLSRAAKGVYVGVAGDLKVDMVNGDTALTFKAPVGLLYIYIKKVYATGTTATNLIGLK